MELSLNLVKVSALLGEATTGEAVVEGTLALVTVSGFFSNIDLRAASFSGESLFTGDVTVELRGRGGGGETNACRFFASVSFGVGIFAPSASSLLLRSGARILLCSLNASASFSTSASALQLLFWQDFFAQILPGDRVVQAGSPARPGHSEWISQRDLAQLGFQLFHQDLLLLQHLNPFYFLV